MSAQRPTARAYGLAMVCAALVSACTEAPLSIPLRSLHSSGPVSFVCLGTPSAELDDYALPLTECSGARTDTLDNFSVPHLYALVTQPIRGEVAVIDLTTNSDAVLDSDPSQPGATFLPIGAQPTDVVSTPGGTASFVAIAEPGFEGIFGLPSSMIRGGAPQLTSWPSCALPSAPDKMVLLLDPADDAGDVRPSCDDSYGTIDDSTCGDPATAHCHGDLARDGERVGTPGRQKLLVSLPAEGGVAILDAQDILDQEAGVFASCVIERWLPLEVSPPALPPAPEPPEPIGGCAPDVVDNEPTAAAYSPLPAGMEFDGVTLYVADREAPVIHRLNLSDPCAPFESAPLLPRSSEDPRRVVTTRRIALSPQTIDFKRYLYAIDDVDGSLMMFDVSDDADSFTPIERPNPATNPFQPSDRIRVNAPPRDVILLHHNNAEVDSTTGAVIPARCDPDPESNSAGTAYQPSASFDKGAGPTRLRGVFGFAVMGSGDILVLDVDDYDAACRTPKDHHPAFGCDADDEASDLNSTGEYSCNVISPHQTRSASFLLQNENVANNRPGVQSLPVLFAESGGTIALEAADSVPRMRATVPESTPPLFELAVASDLEQLDASTGLLLDGTGDTNLTEHTLMANLEDPRAHIVDQAWTVTFEGSLPGFSDRFAQLSTLGDGQLRLTEPTSQFCSRGVHSENAVAAMLEGEGLTPSEAASQALPLADYIQIVSATAVATDPYWSEQSACTFSQCESTFGTLETPLSARDYRIVEATEDALDVTPRSSQQATADVKCCFPGVVEFRVRAGSQWVVLGDATGFLHNVVTSADGVCRDSCNTDRKLLAGRVRETAPGEAVSEDDPRAFKNPFFRFAINGDGSERDMQFRFNTRGAFPHLVLSLATGDFDVQPTATRFLEQTGELVISDGSLAGITLLDVSSLAVSRQYN